MAGSTRPTWDDIGAAGQGPVVSRSPSGEFIYYPGQPQGYLIDDSGNVKTIPTPTAPGSHFIPLPPNTTVTNILGGRSTSVIPKNAPMPRGTGGTAKSMRPGNVYEIMGIPSTGSVSRQGVDMVAPDGTIIQMAPEYRRPFKDELSVYPKK
jgi:hypothetical protein